MTYMRTEHPIGTIRCNAYHCDSKFFATHYALQQDRTKTKILVEAQAEEQGWKRQGLHHYCPGCSKSMQSEKRKLKIAVDYALER